MIREESKMRCSLDGIRRLGPILIAAGLLMVTCRGHDVNTTMASSIGNATLRMNPIGMIGGVPEGTLQEETGAMLAPTSRVTNLSNSNIETERNPQQARKRGGNGGGNLKNTNSTTTPKQNIRHNKQKRGRGKGRGRGRGKGKGRHRHGKSKTKDPSSQHSHIRRNLEKQVLVQNRTLELLGGGGARILWATGGVNASVQTSDIHVKESSSNSSIVPVNLVSSKKTSSTHGILVGLLIKNDTSPNLSVDDSERTPKSKLRVISTTTLSRNVDAMSHVHRNNVSNFSSRAGGGEITVTDYQYDYDAIEAPGVVEPSFWFSPGDSRREDGVRSNGRVAQSGGMGSEGVGIEPGPLQAALGTTLARVLGVLTDHGGSNISHKEEEEDKDPCERWMRCKDKLEKAFLGPLGTLPSCPCHYPSAIFYDDKIWDQSRGKYFRWRDVSGDAERLDVYKPGAAYCIRSLLAQGSTSLAAQHCCYDRFRRLLTRGSGAGTPDFVSPEVSASLHEKVDMLPWKLCKGDFTRYNSVRPPNNDNNCVENPNNEEYQRQVEMTQYF